MSRCSALAAMLREHKPLDASEADHLRRMLALCASPGDPLARDHFVPGHFTASAFVRSAARDALLLVHHRKLDRWLQPGGHVEPADADLLSAAQREVREETGIAELELEHPCPFDLDIHAIPPLGSEPAHAHFDVRFLFRARRGVPAGGGRPEQANSEVKALRFVPLADLCTASSDQSVMRAVRKLAGR